MKKINNSSSKKVNVTKSVRDPIREKSPWMEDYEDFFTHRSHPVNQAFLDKIGLELIEYVENTKTIFRHEWFFTQKRIYPFTARRWADKNDRFGNVYKTAKLILGMRREDKGLRKEFDSSLVSNSMALYDDAWKEMMEWKSKLAEATMSNSGIKVVEIPAFEDADTSVPG